MDEPSADGRSPTSAPSSTRGSTRTTTSSRRRIAPPGHARRADRADAAREVDPVRRGLDAVRAGPSASADSAARRCCAPSSARRSPRATSPTPASSRSIEVLAPDAHRLRAARARGRGRPAAARRARRCGARGSRSRAPAATSRRCSCRAVPDGDPATAPTWVINGQKVWTSLAQYSDRCVLLDAHRPARVAPPRHHRVLRRHGHARHHGRADRDDQRRARVRRGVLRRRRRSRRPHPRRGATAAGRSR